MEEMAFVGGICAVPVAATPVISGGRRKNQRTRQPTRPRRGYPSYKPPSATDNSAEPQTDNSTPLVAVPASLEESAGLAVEAARAARKQGYARLVIEVDTSLGDQTYTILKNTLPLALILAQRIIRDEQQDLLMVVPDSGAAALALRDWKDIPFEIVGLDRLRMENLKADTYVVVSPRASEVERLEKLADAASPNLSPDASSLIMVNPDVVDMGVTGLGFAARELRRRLFSTFETIFYLKSLPWGVLLRVYPGPWTVWLDDTSDPTGFRLIHQSPRRLSSEELETVFDNVNPSQPSPSSSMFDRISRFLSLYMKG
uniref:DUF1995 domain-containing protein n=1 Tax=Compsopogon caeruleus TaxID=31354 RepID=A0A7S1TG31_9RHOD